MAFGYFGYALLQGDSGKNGVQGCRNVIFGCLTGKKRYRPRNWRGHRNQCEEGIMGKKYPWKVEGEQKNTCLMAVWVANRRKRGYCGRGEREGHVIGRR